MPTKVRPWNGPVNNGPPSSGGEDSDVHDDSDDADEFRREVRQDGGKAGRTQASGVLRLQSEVAPAVMRRTMTEFWMLRIGRVRILDQAHGR